MTESKSMILGCAGKSLTREEVRFYRGECPWGFILFARNIGEAEQIRDLVDEMRDCVGRPDAPVFIDQEGGRVQRLRPPLAPNYPAGAALGALWRDDHDAGERAAWLLARLHAFDLLRYGITADCLPVLDVPIEGASDVIGARAYGKKPDIVTALGRASAEGLMSGGVLPVMKHIPGHGRAFSDTHFELPTVDATLRDLQRHDFAPFRELAHLPMAMTAHVVFSAVDPEEPGHDLRQGDRGDHPRRNRLRRAADERRHLDEGAFWGFPVKGRGNPCGGLRYRPSLQRRDGGDGGHRLADDRALRQVAGTRRAGA